MQKDRKYLALLLVAGLVTGCAHARPSSIPPRAILEAHEEDALANVPDPQVYVLGNVKTGGAFAFTPGMTVLHALALAGGFGEWAKLGNITVARDVGGEWLGYQAFNLKRAFARKPVQDFRLRPGDIILVP